MICEKCQKNEAKHEIFGHPLCESCKKEEDIAMWLLTQDIVQKKDIKV